MTKLKSKAKTISAVKLKSQSRTEERWTADTWYALARHYDAMSCDRHLPEELRNKFEGEAEAAFVTGDLLCGITPEMWADYARQDNEACEARRRGEEIAPPKSPSELAAEAREARLALYSVRSHIKKKPTKSRSNKRAQASQLELKLA